MMLKVVFLSSILCLFLVRISGECLVTCSDKCYVNNQGPSSLCDLIIDEAKLTAAGLNSLPASVELRLNLSGTITKVSFILLLESVTVRLLTEEVDDLTNVQLSGPFVLESDFFKLFPDLTMLSLMKVVFSGFPIFRFNFKLVTLECVDIEVSSGTTDITWSFINGLNSLISIKFVSSAKLDSGTTFNGLDALTKIEFDKVDFSVALPTTFGSVNTLVEVSLTNGKLSNLELIPIAVRSTIVELELTNNLLDELDEDNFKGFNALTKLVLANNRFTKLKRTLFLETPLLDTLDLSGNQITTIEIGTFYADSKLKTVLLVDSLLKQLSYHVLAPLVTLELFALDGNPLTCDCGLFWVSIFHDKFGKSFESGTNAKCVAPIEELNNKVYLSSTYEQCDHNYSCFCIGSGSDMECEGQYECLLGLPTTQSIATTNTTGVINATIATNATTNTTLSSETTLPAVPPTGFVGLQVVLILGFSGFFILLVLFIVVIGTFCICCCCFNDNSRSSYYV